MERKMGKEKSVNKENKSSKNTIKKSLVLKYLSYLMMFVACLMVLIACSIFEEKKLNARFSRKKNCMSIGQ